MPKTTGCGEQSAKRPANFIMIDAARRATPPGSALADRLNRYTALHRGYSKTEGHALDSQTAGSRKSDQGKWFRKGLADGIPICLGYFAVSFSLGIAARGIGMNGWQGFWMSSGMVASAGEFAAIELLKTGAGALEIIITCLIVNLRYCLMSCALTQKLPPGTRGMHRFGLAYCITDEIFALSAAVQGYLVPHYTYGITLIAVTGWASGTVLGITAGNILPGWAVHALGVSIYGMFLAIIIPPAKKDRFIAGLIAVSMAASLLFTQLPPLSRISPGFRIIILTIVIAGAAAAVHPLEEPGEEPHGA